MPGIFTVGLRQGIVDRWTFLAGFEWSNWGRIGTANLLQPNGAAATIGGRPVTFPFQYSDGYFYSAGLEHVYNTDWTLRAGIAFEQSPITDAVRTPRLPDNDRMWYSIGGTYKHPQFKGLSFDLGYSYIDVKNAPINISTTSGNPWCTSATCTTYIGSVSSHIHILSIAARYQFDAVAPAKKLITK